jgi:hypothetical protein
MSTDDGPGSLPLSSIAVIAGLVVVLVAGFVVLILSGNESSTTTYTLFVTGPLVTGFTTVLLARRVKKVEVIAATVEHQTNGVLSAQLAAVHEHIDQQTEQLLPAAPAPAQDAPRSPLPTSRVPPGYTAQSLSDLERQVR